MTTFGEKLCELLDERKISQRKLAQLVPCDTGHLSRIVRDLKRPSAQMAARIDEILGADGSLAAVLPTPSRPKGSRAAAAGTVNATVTHNDWAAMERRALLQLLAVLAPGAAVSAAHLETLRSGLERALGVRDEFTVEDWEQAVADHAYSIRVMAPAALVAVLSSDIADVGHALDHRPDLDRPTLQRVSAQLAALMAMALNELNDPHESGWWRTAHHAAASAGDRNLEVYTHGRQARVTYSRPGALKHADQAIALAGNRPSAGLAEAHATRAVALARTGDRSGAEQALRDLDELYVRLPAELTGDEATVWGWPRQRYLGERTGVRLNLGDSSLYGEMPSLDGTREARDLAWNELYVAWARINAGSVSDGLEDAANTLNGLPKEHRTSSVRATVGRMVSALPEKARALPAARELRALTSAT
ncbi:helix-turn-helix domain-containing protein [Actinomadura rubrisoli]|uniref:XRE family transcriptional regulator n=1 Tax=Actinomadura rubrisoli TaxID=2530368 RepID=A0A4R5BMZ8_9ACTN|nr:helix-turn-helix transcriptional regulator [Actinomadura rubrisoli]TDD86713.1 XRE family transcriptional regulator [Actinomadura rubrisoli]